MNVCVGAMFRDSADYIDRTLGQYKALEDTLVTAGHRVRFSLVENDTTDDTRERLEDFVAQRPDSVLTLRSDGCPYFPSKDFRERWRHLAWVANGALEQVSEDDDVFLYVESDLQWEPETMVRLIGHLDTVDVVSPLNVRESGSYYDLWGSRGMDGRRFTIQPPYHPSLTEGLVEVQSMAGCTAMVADVARMTRFDPLDCYVGWNRAMRLAGFRVWCDPTLRVVHG